MAVLQCFHYGSYLAVSVCSLWLQGNMTVNYNYDPLYSKADQFLNQVNV